MRTKIPGVYAIGDVREKHCVKSRQRSVKAVLLDNKYLTILKIKIKMLLPLIIRAKAFLIGSFNDKIRAANGSS